MKRECATCGIGINGLHFHARLCRNCVKTRELIRRRKYYCNNTEEDKRRSREWAIRNPEANRRKSLAWLNRNKAAVNEKKRERYRSERMNNRIQRMSNKCKDCGKDISWRLHGNTQRCLPCLRKHKVERNRNRKKAAT